MTRGRAILLHLEFIALLAVATYGVISGIRALF